MQVPRTQIHYRNNVNRQSEIINVENLSCHSLNSDTSAFCVGAVFDITEFHFIQKRRKIRKEKIIRNKFISIVEFGLFDILVYISIGFFFLLIIKSLKWKKLIKLTMCCPISNQLAIWSVSVLSKI